MEEGLPPPPEGQCIQKAEDPHGPPSLVLGKESVVVDDCQ